MAVLESVRVQRVQFEAKAGGGGAGRQASCEVRAHVRPAGELRAVVLLVARFFEGDPDPPFRLEVGVEGLFRLDPGETPKQLVTGPGPATLYPYLRDEVAYVTLRGGLPPILLPSLATAPPVQIREDVN